jgi:nucleotide-binding universal stress UspA family protein
MALAVDAEADPAAELAWRVAADAALIVLWSTHRTGLGRVLPGTTADHVLHAAPCAVAVAPAGYADRPREPLGVIVAAVDGGDETERVARIAARIAGGSGAAVRAIRSSTPRTRRWPRPMAAR